MIDPLQVKGQAVLDESYADVPESYPNLVLEFNIDKSLPLKEQGKLIMNEVENWDFDGDASVAWTNGWVSGMKYMLSKLT